MDGDKSKKPNLIGISGKIGHGKDLIGLIIQALSEDNLTNSEVVEIATGKLVLPTSNWEVKKMAGKLKDITCLLLGCTREQLEDQQFKGTILGDEWTKWGIIREHGTRLVDIKGTEEEAKKRVANWGKDCSVEKVLMTPRLFMQLLGTECGRDILHPNIWANALFADYKPRSMPSSFPPPSIEEEYKRQLNYPKWLVTDVRFPNEAEAIKSRDGILIRVNRTNLVDDDRLKDEHPSETGLDDYQEWDYVLENDGTIEDLIEKVKQLDLV